MQFFVVAYALGFLLWRAQDGKHPWLLLVVILAVTLWVVLWLRHRRLTLP